jgi:EamA domain-containing membrane protein RarD
MTTSQRVRFWLYLSLAIIGLVSAWTFNALAVLDKADYMKAWFGSAVDWVLGADLAIVAIAVVIFMFAEGSRLGMKHVWIYVVLAGVTAMAFTLPLFLAMRERHLARATNPSGLVTSPVISNR